MSRSNCLVGLVAMALFAGGCDAFDYYPTHETPEKTSDLRKQGPDNYGGNNDSFPSGTPGTSGTTQPTAAAPTAAPTPPSGATGPTFNTNGQTAFAQTGSYSGAAVGGALPGGATTPFNATAVTGR